MNSGLEFAPPPQSLRSQMLPSMPPLTAGPLSRAVYRRNSQFSRFYWAEIDRPELA